MSTSPLTRYTHLYWSIQAHTTPECHRHYVWCFHCPCRIYTSQSRSTWCSHRHTSSRSRVWDRGRWWSWSAASLVQLPLALSRTARVTRPSRPRSARTSRRPGRSPARSTASCASGSTSACWQQTGAQPLSSSCVRSMYASPVSLWKWTAGPAPSWPICFWFYGVALGIPCLKPLAQCTSVFWKMLCLSPRWLWKIHLRLSLIPRCHLFCD